jgi:thiol-disulfide isomerase/thioredoxin
MRGAATWISTHAVRRGLIVGAVLVGAVAAALVLDHYGTEFVTDGSDSQTVAAVPAAADVRSASSDAFRFSFFDQPRPLPELRFVDADGQNLSLRDFHGRPVLLNIWATWCVPCRKEMPSLDRLQAGIDKSELLVLPLSIDRQGTPVVARFYQELGLKALGIYVDQSGKASSDLNTVGVPTTLLIDRDGREIGRKIGPAEWDGPEMTALLREHLGLTGDRKAAR